MRTERAEKSLHKYFLTLGLNVEQVNLVNIPPEIFVQLRLSEELALLHGTDFNLQ